SCWSHTQPCSSCLLPSSRFPSFHAHQTPSSRSLSFFFFNDPAPTELYTLSLHDALPISPSRYLLARSMGSTRPARRSGRSAATRSEEHTSELQSLTNLVCRLLLEKKKKTHTTTNSHTATASR